MWVGKQDDSTTLQNVYSMHRWQSLQRGRLKSVGELSKVCSQIVLKCWKLARIGRPDILWSLNKLARSITKWTKACDKRLNRLISNISSFLWMSCGCELVIETTQQIYQVATPWMDDHQFKEEGIGSVCSPIVLKCLYLCQHYTLFLVFYLTDELARFCDWTLQPCAHLPRRAHCSLQSDRWPHLDVSHVSLCTLQASTVLVCSGHVVNGKCSICSYQRRRNWWNVSHSWGTKSIWTDGSCQHSWRTMRSWWKLTHSWKAMREWLEVVTPMEYHEVDRDTCSTCSTVIDVGDCWVSRTQG